MFLDLRVEVLSKIDVALIARLPIYVLPIDADRATAERVRAAASGLGSYFHFSGAWLGGY